MRVLTIAAVAVCVGVVVSSCVDNSVHWCGVGETTDRQGSVVLPCRDSVDVVKRSDGTWLIGGVTVCQ